MKIIKGKMIERLQKCLALAAFLPLIMLAAVDARSQTIDPAPSPEKRPAAESAYNDHGFRVEKMRVEGGSDLITIFAKHDETSEIPLVSILRDTLGDDIPENDRLRYVWMHTYTEPSLRQKIGSFVPFLYTRTSNAKLGTKEPAPVVIDVQASSKTFWEQFLWLSFRKLVLGDFGPIVRASTSQFRQNATDYHKSSVAAALTILSLYQESSGEKIFSDSELKDIQARLFLTTKAFGWHMQPENLGRVYDKQTAEDRDYRGHNWELLRQYSEAQGLYFEPLEMPDGSARHALVWTTVSDVAANKGKSFNHRFLNFRNPWTDKKLAEWKGYTQVRWFDEDDREVAEGTPNSRPKTMIPLALYGLDNPKIPMILIDFRDNGNPKFREMSKRIFNDVTSNVLALGTFSSFPYFMGRFIYELVPGRRGLDINQASRVRAYSQLKLLLSLENGLDPEFRDKIENSIEHATLNPMENDADVEAKLAKRQYANLMAFAARPDGLQAKVQNDRREEMARLYHGKFDRTLFAISHAITFGQYTHRETETPELLAQMDLRRQLDFHERFLREVAFRSANPEIDSNVAEVKRSLSFIAQNGMAGGDKTTRALAKIFKVSKSDDLQNLCLAGLYRINNGAAKNELLAIYKDPKVDERLREMSARYLKLALKEGQRMWRRDATAVGEIAANSATTN